MYQINTYFDHNMSLNVRVILKIIYYILKMTKTTSDHPFYRMSAQTYNNYNFLP